MRMIAKFKNKFREKIKVKLKLTNAIAKYQVIKMVSQFLIHIKILEISKFTTK